MLILELTEWTKDGKMRGISTSIEEDEDREVMEQKLEIAVAALYSELQSVGDYVDRELYARSYQWNDR